MIQIWFQLHIKTKAGKQANFRGLKILFFISFNIATGALPCLTKLFDIVKYD